MWGFQDADVQLLRTWGRLPTRRRLLFRARCPRASGCGGFQPGKVQDRDVHVLVANWHMRSRRPVHLRPWSRGDAWRWLQGGGHGPQLQDAALRVLHGPRRVRPGSRMLIRARSRRAANAWIWHWQPFSGRTTGSCCRQHGLHRSSRRCTDGVSFQDQVVHPLRVRFLLSWGSLHFRPWEGGVGDRTPQWPPWAFASSCRKSKYAHNACAWRPESTTQA
mmetsp:Transcript_13876/g.37746  ORF Transcript_13876/g.37746 Transcript_13876/m.37746 type:complete len:219 (-) Transcript_13876:751-1407(-)